MKYEEIRKKCPSVTFQNLHPSNKDAWQLFLKRTAKEIGIASEDGVLLGLRLFFQKVCGYKANDNIEITDYIYSSSGISFTCLINGLDCLNLKFVRTIHNDKRLVNEVVWQIGSQDYRSYEVLFEETPKIQETNSLNDIYSKNIRLTFRPLRYTKKTDKSIVDCTTKYIDGTGYRTEIYMKPHADSSYISIDYHHGANIPLLTINKDEPYILHNYELLSDYLLGLDTDFDLENIYTRICDISFGNALDQIDDLKLRIYRTIMVSTLITGKFPYKCCADEIWVGKGKLDYFCLDGTGIYTGGKVDTYYGSNRFHNVDNDYINSISFENQWVNNIRNTATKAAQMFPKESRELFGLGTESESKLLSDIWQENSLQGQLHLFGLMADYPTDSSNCDYAGSSEDNAARYEQIGLFDESAKQFVKINYSKLAE